MEPVDGGHLVVCRRRWSTGVRGRSPGRCGGGRTGGGAANQKVEAALACQPGTVAPSATTDMNTTGCVLTVTNIGGNNVNSSTVTVTASAGSHMSRRRTRAARSAPTRWCSRASYRQADRASPRRRRCSRRRTSCRRPAQRASEVDADGRRGRYSSSTGTTCEATIDHRHLDGARRSTTDLNALGDFDGKFSNAAADAVHTDSDLVASGNLYSTGATLSSTTGFAVGLTVEEKDRKGGTTRTARAPAASAHR